MAEVVIRIKDTPTGGVAVHAVYEPALRVPCTKAQLAALEIVRRTTREWNLSADAVAKKEAK